MANHQNITGKNAVHPFAFVQSTDPALDVLNGVTANKAWVDTSVSPVLLKIRDATNTVWTTLLGATVGRPFLPMTLLVGPFMSTSLALPMPEATPLPVTLLTHL